MEWVDAIQGRRPTQRNYRGLGKQHKCPGIQEFCGYVELIPTAHLRLFSLSVSPTWIGKDPSFVHFSSFFVHLFLGTGRALRPARDAAE